MRLTAAELERYSRHILLPQVGLKGQARLKSSKVLCVGAGGLGSPASMYLAAAGVGVLGLADHDAVELSNLQRQLLHSAEDVGRPKLDSARRRLAGINPGVRVRLHRVRLDNGNAGRLIRDYDVVIDGADNLPTRGSINDACVRLGKPFVYGSVFRFEGQVSVFWPRKGGPCYRCLFPRMPPPGSAPACGEAGVLGALPGVIGTLQAIEALKLLLRQGEPLIGRLLLFDALAMEFRRLSFKRDPRCESCGPRRGAPRSQGGAEQEDDAPSISPEELKALLDSRERVQLLDVREPEEHAICRIRSAKLVPLGRLERALEGLDKSAELVVHCKTGRRSARAVRLLRARGFRRARSLAGGISAWAERVEPSLPRY